MANEKRQRVKFTGKRTGRSDMPIKGIGIISVGDVIEVDADTAARYIEELPSRDDKMLSDFAAVGEPFTVSAEDAPSHDLKQREKYAVSAEDALPDEVSTEPAHEVAETGTVEEEAEVLRVENDDEDEDKKKKASAKK